MESLYEELSKTIIFRGMDSESVAKLLENKIFRLKKFNSDEYVAYNEDICKNLLIIIKGSVRGDMTDFSGKTIKIEDIMAPSPIAAAFIFGQNNRFPVDVIANEQTTVLILPKESLIKIFREEDRVLKNFLNVISNRTQFLSNKIKFLSFKTIKGKIAHYILEVAGKDKSEIVLPKTHAELAEFFGVTRPSISRAFIELQKENIISLNRKNIVIKNKSKLVEYLQ